MDEETRRNKIEAGKKKLKKFMKKRNKRNTETDGSTSDVVTSPHTSSAMIEEDIENDEQGVSEASEVDGLESVKDLLLFSRHQIENHHNEIKKRDVLIIKLTSQLNASIEAQQLAYAQGTAQVDALTQEVNVLRLQLKEATEVLEKYKHSAQTLQESSDSQTELVNTENIIPENELALRMMNERYEICLNKFEVPNENTNDLEHEDCEKMQELELKNIALSKKLADSKINMEKSDDEVISLRAYIDELMKKNSSLEKELAIYKLRVHSVKDEDPHASSVSTSLPSSCDLPGHTAPSARGHLAVEQLSTESCSWQVQAAQTNARLLHVLCNLVKMNLDIETDINTRLVEFGLASQSSEIVNHDDDTGQSVGSREDCTGLSVGESPNLELTEDGPDLTPRAWDLFSSIVAYDSEVEGEDVVIGASRRLRCAVSHVLNLLSIIFDKTNQTEYKALLKRNEDLANDLHTEYEDKGDLQLSLIIAESESRKLRSEKQALESENLNLVEDKEILTRQIETFKSKIMLLEEQRDRACEAEKFLENQCQILSDRYDEPERTTVHKSSSCSEITLHESPGLIQQNTKLSSEKQRIQMQSNKERHSLSSRVQHLEVALEEMQMEKEEVVEKYKSEIKDLNSQIEAMDKQLQSSKKFREEQDMDREQEREEHLREIKKYREALKEKDKLHNTDEHFVIETETLERQLREKIEENMIIIGKKEDLERELRHSLDKINDLKDVINEYEKQLEMKSKNEDDFKEKLKLSAQAVSELKKRNSELSDQLDHYKSSQTDQVSIEYVQDLEERLASKSHDLDLLSQSHSLLQEFRGQIHFLEAKVHRTTRHLETMNLVSQCSSPVSSDASQAESHDSDVQNVSCEGWEMSPRSINWLELHRLEEKISRLTYLEEELIKRNKNLTERLKELNELNQDKVSLQEKVTEQQTEISGLKMYISELQNSVPATREIPSNSEVELRKLLQQERDMKEHALAIKQEFKEKLMRSQAELHDKKKSLQKLLKKHHKMEITKETQTEEVRCKEETYNKIQELQTENRLLTEGLVEAKEAFQKLELNAKETIRDMETGKEEVRCKEETYNKIQELQTENRLLTEGLVEAKEAFQKLELNAKETIRDMETGKEEVRCKEEEIYNKIQKLQTENKRLTEGLVAAKEAFQKLELNAKETIRDMETGKDYIVREMAKDLEIVSSQLNDINTRNSELEQLLSKTKENLTAERMKSKSLKEKLIAIKSSMEEVKGKEEETNKKLQKLHTENRFLNENLLKAKASFEKLGLSSIEQIRNMETDKNFIIQEITKELERPSSQLVDANTRISQLEELLSEAEGNLTAEKLKSESLQKKLIAVELTREELKHKDEEIQTLHADKKLLVKELQKSKADAKKFEIEALNIKKAMETDKIRLENDFRTMQSIAEKKEKELHDLSEEVENLLHIEAELDMKTETVSTLKQSLEQFKASYKHDSELWAKRNEELRAKHSEEMGNLQNQIFVLKSTRNCMYIDDIDINEAQDKIMMAAEALKIIYNSDESKNIFANTIFDILKHTVDCKVGLLKKIHKKEIDNLNLTWRKKLEVEELRVKECETVCSKRTIELANCEKHAKEKMQKLYSEQLAKHVELHDHNKRELSKLVIRINELKAERDAILRDLSNATTEVEAKKKFFEETLLSLENKYEGKFSTIKIEASKEREKWKEERRKLLKEFEKRQMETNASYERELMECKASYEEDCANKIKIEEIKNAKLNRYLKKLKCKFKAEKEKIMKEKDALRTELNDLLKILDSGKKGIGSPFTVNDQPKRESPRSVLEVRESTSVSPDSDVNFTSDDTCNSCHHDLYEKSPTELLNKVRDEADQVLNQFQSQPGPSSGTDIDELIQEREILIFQLRATLNETTVTPDAISVLNNIVPEVQNIFDRLCTIANIFKRRNLDLQSSVALLVRHLKNNMLGKSSSSVLNPVDSSESSDSSKSSDSSESDQCLEIEKERDAGLSHTKESFIEEVHTLPNVEISPSSTSLHHNGSDLRTEPLKYESLQRLDFIHEFPWVDETGELELSFSEQPIFSNDVLDPRRSIAKQLHSLYWKYKRTKSHLKAVVFQKRYLKSVLTGFQATEEVVLVALAVLHERNLNVALSNYYLLRHPTKLTGCSMFRSIAFVVVAIKRMKFIVAHWRKAAMVSDTSVVEREAAIMAGCMQTGNMSAMEANRSPISSLSTPTSSLSMEDIRKKRDEDERKASQLRIEDPPEQGHLSQYVLRLEQLHRQLGLSDIKEN